jgi:hypothetical protein
VTAEKWGVSIESILLKDVTSVTESPGSVAMHVVADQRNGGMNQVLDRVAAEFV